jgi:hypothetical protein
MTTVPMPSSPARNLLAMAGLSVLCATVGCQLGESDVVARSPDLAHGSDGSSGQDALGTNEAAHDTAPLDLSSADSAGVAEDTSEMDGNGTESGSGMDSVGVRGDTGSDTPLSIDETGDGSDVASACSAEGYEFCEGFEDGAALWVSTGGPWDVVNVSGPSGTSSVFVPLTAGATIAYAPIGVWQDMTVEADVMVTSFGQPTSSNRAEIYARYQDPNHFYAVGLRGDGKLGLRRNSSGLGTAATVSIAENQWHKLKIRVSGSADQVIVEGYLDGALLATAPDTSGSATGDNGTVGVGVYGGTLAVFDNVKVSSP